MLFLVIKPYFLVSCNASSPNKRLKCPFSTLLHSFTATMLGYRPRHVWFSLYILPQPGLAFAVVYDVPKSITSGSSDTGTSFITTSGSWQQANCNTFVFLYFPIYLLTASFVRSVVGEPLHLAQWPCGHGNGVYAQEHGAVEGHLFLTGHHPLVEQVSGQQEYAGIDRICE